MKLLLTTLLALIAGPAFAAEPSKCGAFATGLKDDGTVWTGAAPRMWVDRDGKWRVCQPWIADGGDPEAPEPPASKPCPAEDTYRTWTASGNQCSSIPPGPTTSTTTKLQRTDDGRVGYVIDEWGNETGILVMRCVKGNWQFEGSTCDAKVPPAPEPKERPTKPVRPAKRVG